MNQKSRLALTLIIVCFAPFEYLVFLLGSTVGSVPILVFLLIGILAYIVVILTVLALYVTYKMFPINKSRSKNKKFRIPGKRINPPSGLKMNEKSHS